VVVAARSPRESLVLIVPARRERAKPHTHEPGSGILSAMTYPANIALNMLREGNERFVAGRQKPHYTRGERLGVAREQRPWAVVVGCSDSRVPVEVVFDVGPGELFVIRVAGHVMSEAGYASVRYAVEVLGTKLVVVLGHEDCGAVSAALEGDAPLWLAPITDHIHFRPDATLAEAVDGHVLESVGEVRSWFAREGFDSENPVVVGAAYQLASGEVRWL
jgi:carbonic anhydrase